MRFHFTMDTVCLLNGVLLGLVLHTSGAAAQEIQGHRDGDLTHGVEAEKAVDMSKSYVLGIGRFDLDAHTEIIGWRLADAWYFGRQDGLDSGLTLVWQKNLSQISFSKDGLRLTRRF